MTINFIDGLFFKQQNIGVKEDFDTVGFAEALANIHREKGFEVKTIQKDDVCIIEIEKDMGGFGLFFGKEQSITIQVKQSGKVLTLDYSNGAWLGKIIGIAFGVILCYVPTVKSIIGVINQNKLYKGIVEQAEKLAQK